MREMILLVFLLAPLLQSAPVPFPNCGQFGQGYNLIRGNPHAALVDPGLRQRVVDFNSFYVSPDKRFLIPEPMTIDQSVSCDYTSKSVVIRSMVDYKRSLDDDVSLGLGLFGFSFSVSDEYKRMEEDIYNTSTKHVSAEAVCSVYSVKMDLDWMPLNFTVEFQNAVHDLSLNLGSMRLFFKFFDDFGTHLISEGLSGAKFVLDSEFNFEEWQKIHKEGTDLSAGASASLKQFSGCAKAMTSHEKELAKEFDTTRTSFRENTIGSPPPRDGNWQTWANAVGKTPVVIKYHLKPIADMLDSIHFPWMANGTVVALSKAMNLAFSQYCASIPSCGSPKPIYSSCLDLKKNAKHRKSGAYSINFLSDPRRKAKWYCLDMEGDLPPRDFIPLPHAQTAELHKVNRDHGGCEFDLLSTVTHRGVPVDAESLAIRKNDPGMAHVKGNPMCPFGATYSVGTRKHCHRIMHSECWCDNYGEYSLVGTPFAFDAEETKYVGGHISFRDTHDQVVKVKGVDGIPPLAGPFGISNLKYIAISKK